MKIYYIGEAKKDPQKSQILGKLRLRTKREKKKSLPPPPERTNVDNF